MDDFRKNPCYETATFVLKQLKTGGFNLTKSSSPLSVFNHTDKEPAVYLFNRFGETYYNKIISEL
jgi:hypothetical protein